MPREYLFRRVRPNGGIDVELRVQRDGEGLVIGLADEESGAIVIELRRDDVAGLHDRLGKWLAVTPKAERASD